MRSLAASRHVLSVLAGAAGLLALFWPLGMTARTTPQQASTQTASKPAKPAVDSSYAGEDKIPVVAPDAYQTALTPLTPGSVSESRKAWDAKVRELYNFGIDKSDIALPANAKIEGDAFIEPGSFPNAKYCGHCHQEAYHQWRQALHSNSFRTPFYRDSVNIVMHTKGIQFARHCDSCHNPIAVLSGGLTQASIVDRKFDQDGLTCMTCHSVQRLQSTSGNGGYVMGVPAVMTDAGGRRIPGEVPFDQILMHPDWHARAVMQPFYRTPEFCASCHKANLPNPLNSYKFLRAFTAYDEWQSSKFSQRNPLTFYKADFQSCQNCHMERSQPVLPEPGAKAGTFASHRWLAGNTAVPFYYGFDEQLSKTVAFLKTGNYLNIDIFGIKINEDDTLLAPLEKRSFALKAGDSVQAYVVIQNKNIGHSLVPEVRDLYEAWVEFSVVDSDGNTLYHSGFLKPDGSLDTRAHSFTNRPVNTDGVFVDNHMVWTIHSVAYDNTVSAGRSALVRYKFNLPPNIKGAVTMTAKVNYRHLRQSYLDNIFGKDDHPQYPVVELSSTSRALQIGANTASQSAPDANPEWMRWNNLGIGYLDQLQYADAVAAFSEVVKLRPDYSDGYVNVALTNIEWEKFSSARGSLERALKLDAENARALYYMGIVERREGHADEEIADFRRVVEMFPQSRDARRELGIAYYQQSKPVLAMEQFKALQAIDPDDLAAHYNLALLYRRAGDKKMAAQEAAMYATEKVDPGAPTYSLDFLRQHPEISSESVPWHVHDDSKTSAQKIVPVKNLKSTWQY